MFVVSTCFMMPFCTAAGILLRKKLAGDLTRSQVKSLQRVAERDIAEEIVLDTMLHGINF